MIADKPKVSVIIPVYNVEEYLRECLDSIINQTLNDLEIICINDGSTDNSPDILQQYKSKDTRIIIINQENKGAGAARNTGLEKAAGKYIAFLDSDDIYDSHMLEKMYKKAITKDLDITICRSKQLNQKTQKITRTEWTINKKWLPNKDVFNYKDMPSHIIGFCLGWSWDKLYKHSFLQQSGLKFPEIHNSEDAMFTYAAICKAEKISIVDNVLVTHRTNTGTQLSERREESPLCFIEGALALKKYLEKQNLYKEIEQSYINWFTEHSFWHLDTLNLKSTQEIEVKLKEVFNSIGVFEHDKDYFYYPDLTEKLQCLTKNIPYDLYKLEHKSTNSHNVINFLGIKIKIRRRA